MESFMVSREMNLKNETHKENSLSASQPERIENSEEEEEEAPLEKRGEK